VPGDPESRAVDANECFSLVYSNQYVDFEILPSSTLKGGDLKRWLVWRSILESMTVPMPPPKAKSANQKPPRGARAAQQAQCMTTPANEKDDVTLLDKALEASGSFTPVVEMGTLPQPFLSPSNASVKISQQAAVLHGQPLKRTAGNGSTVLPGGPGPHVDLSACLLPEALVQTSKLEAKRAGLVTTHGCEPAPFSKTAVVAAKTNQDCGCVIWPLCGDPTLLFLGVFDGHGELGHRASKYCMRRIAESLTAEGAPELKDKKSCSKALVKAFEDSNTMLAQKHLDWGNDGGSTAVGMVVSGDKCVVANCGDSRIVVATRARANAPLKAKDLSTDHTPLLPEEKARIEKAGGWVAQDDEESEARVWLDRDMSCGLAMSRSLGDLAFKAIGVTATPEITEFTLTKANEFVVACSDGVWGVMSSQECVDIVAASQERQPGKELNAFLAAQEVIAEAARRWKDEEGDYRDDITCIVLKLPLFKTSGLESPSRSSRSGSPRPDKATRPTSPRLSRPSLMKPSTPKTPTSSSPGGPSARPASPRPTSAGSMGSWLKKKTTPKAKEDNTSAGPETAESGTPNTTKKKTTLRRIVSVKEPQLVSGSKM